MELLSGFSFSVVTKFCKDWNEDSLKESVDPLECSKAVILIVVGGSSLLRE